MNPMTLPRHQADQKGGTAGDDERRKVVALVARAPVPVHPPAGETEQLQQTMDRLAVQLAAARQRHELAGVVNDALAAHAAARETALRREWRTLCERPDVVRLKVLADAAILQVQQRGCAVCRWVQLQADGVVRVYDDGDCPLTLASDTASLLGRYLATGRVNALVDRLTNRRTDLATPGDITASSAQEDAFVRLLLPHLAARWDEARLAVSAASVELDRLEREWNAAARRYCELVADLPGAQPRRCSPAEGGNDPYDRLCALPDVAMVRSEGNTLVITTRRILVPWEQAPYDLGCFRLRLDLAAQTIEVRAKQQCVQGVDHPHISSGRPCFGAHAGAVRALWHDRDIVALVRFLLLFLHSYNPESAYRPLREWPVLPDRSSQSSEAGERDAR